MINKLLRNYRIKNTIAMIMVLFVIVSSSINSYISYVHFKEIECTSIEKILKTAALTANNLLGDDFFTKALDKDAISTEEDKNNIFNLSLLAKSLDVAYVYSMILQNGKVYFTSSSATEDDNRSSQVTKYFDEYKEATPLLHNILDINHTVFEISTDKWGTFKTIFIPLTTNDGHSYIVGADIKIDAITKMLDEYLQHIFVLQTIIVFILSVLSFLFIKISRKEFLEIQRVKDLLDEEIEQKTKALADLNNSLEDRIKIEIEKNQQKERYMLQQSKLAQMGEMISMIAHQWRQPLSAISAASSVLTVKAKRDQLDAKLALEIATKIKDFAFHLSETIDDFRNFFRADKEKTQTDFLQVLESVESIVGDSLEQHNIELVKDIKRVVVFNAYENEIKQVLLNLIKNAEDALIEKDLQTKKIFIEIDNDFLSVSDNAGGIAEEIIDKIFEPYFSTKIKKDGTGLGLYMSKIIVEEHCRGKLEVKNKDDGACFKMTLEVENG